MSISSMEGELNCKTCRKRVPVKEMKFSKDGSGLVCEDCTNREKHGVNVKVQPIPRPVEAERKKIAYYCKSCNFRFSRAIDFRGPSNCPNCSRNTIIANLPKNADDLMRELEYL